MFLSYIPLVYYNHLKTYSNKELIIIYLIGINARAKILLVLYIIVINSLWRLLGFVYIVVLNAKVFGKIHYLNIIKRYKRIEMWLRAYMFMLFEEDRYHIVYMGKDEAILCNNRLSLLCARIHYNAPKAKHYPSLLFRKSFEGHFEYHDYYHMKFKKCIIEFLTNKESTYIEYQINLTGYFGKLTEIFMHIFQHLLRIKSKIITVLSMVYIFQKTVALPRHKRLAYMRISPDNLENDLEDFIIHSLQHYRQLYIEDYYQITTSKNHIALRVYFLKPCSYDFLQIEPFMYVERVYVHLKDHVTSSKKKNTIFSLTQIIKCA